MVEVRKAFFKESTSLHFQKHYLNPLREKAKAPGSKLIIIPLEDIKIIFSVSENIYAVNSAFLKQLEAGILFFFFIYNKQENY